MPLAKQMTYQFFEQGTDIAAEVKVTVDGVAQMDAPDGGADGDMNTVATASFTPGSRVVIETAGTTENGQAIDVSPTLTMNARFSNDIGLDIDLEGLFQAFAFNLSAFGADIIDIGPLLKFKNTLATFDIGSVFQRTFDLLAQPTKLDKFTLFEQSMDGRTAATAFMTEPTAIPNLQRTTVAADAITPGRPVFVKSDLIDPAAPDQLYTVLNVSVTGAPVNNLYVLDDSLTVTPLATPGSFQITGFTQQMLSERSSALFAISFGAKADATVSTLRATKTTISGLPPTDPGNIGVVSKSIFDQAVLWPFSATTLMAMGSPRL